MNGYEACSTYLTVKLHFNSYYDFFKYHGKSRTSVSAFDRRKDKYLFHKIARELNEQEYQHTLAIMFFTRDKVFSSDILDPETTRNYNADIVWRKFWKDNFTNDLKTIGNFESAIKCKNGQYSEIITLVFQEEISYNTLFILEQHLKLVTTWNNILKGDFIWDSYYKKFKKYEPFFDNCFIPIGSVQSKFELLGYLKT